MEPKSQSTGEPCSPAHYLAELAVTRKAKATRKVLTHKFWNQTEWKKDYKQQIMAAHSLLKIFDLEVILAALSSKDGSWMYSLNTKSLPSLCQREKQRIELERKIARISKPIEYNPDNVTQIPSVQRKTSVGNRLKEFDEQINGEHT